MREGPDGNFTVSQYFKIDTKEPIFKKIDEIYKYAILYSYKCLNQ